MNKKSAIYQMYYGEKGYYENMKPSAEYLSLLNKVCESEEVLYKKLKHSPKLLNCVKTHFDNFSDMHSQELFDNYKEGFKFGVLMGMEIVSD